MIEALDIDVPIAADLDTAMREFESAYTGFTTRQNGGTELPPDLASHEHPLPANA